MANHKLDSHTERASLMAERYHTESAGDRNYPGPDGENRTPVGFVYEWTNTVNGKKYIGGHIGHPDDGYTGSGTFFQFALREYGKNAFVRELLHVEYDDPSNVWEIEAEMIEAADAVQSDRYYNQSVPGSRPMTPTKFVRQPLPPHAIGGPGETLVPMGLLEIGLSNACVRTIIWLWGLDEDRLAGLSLRQITLTFSRTHAVAVHHLVNAGLIGREGQTFTLLAEPWVALMGEVAPA